MQASTVEPVKKDIQVTLRLTSDEHERWLATAESQGIALATWIRQQCNGIAVSKDLIEAVAKKVEERLGVVAQPVRAAPYDQFPPEVKARIARGGYPTDEEVETAMAKLASAPRPTKKKGGR
jgi:hypothetical protein